VDEQLLFQEKVFSNDRSASTRPKQLSQCGEQVKK
jgi:hypothetical protein